VWRRPAPPYPFVSRGVSDRPGASCGHSERSRSGRTGRIGRDKRKEANVRAPTGNRLSVLTHARASHRRRPNSPIVLLPLRVWLQYGPYSIYRYIYLDVLERTESGSWRGLSHSPGEAEGWGALALLERPGSVPFHPKRGARQPVPPTASSHSVRRHVELFSPSHQLSLHPNRPADPRLVETFQYQGRTGASPIIARHRLFHTK